MDPIRLILLEPSGKKHMVLLDRTTVTLPQLGVVRTEVLVESIGKLWKVGSRSFLVLTPSIRETVGLLKRNAQIVGPKDLPALLWNGDVKPGDLIIEVGAGSGALTVALANAVGPNGRVVSYDLRRDFLEVARGNVEAAGLADRVEFKIGDARSPIPERGADAFVVDIPDPWECIGPAWQTLRPCGHFTAFSPNVEQMSRTVKGLEAAHFVDVRTLEILEREMVAHDTGTHPSFAPLGHTGYLTFARKVLEKF